MPRHPQHVKLLHGPYRPPALQRGDRATCLFRDGDVIITSWSDARIPWPRCRMPGGHGGGSGLLVDDELAHAIRTESVLALRYWFGVSAQCVKSWRRAFGVPTLNEGSALLREQLNRDYAERLRGIKLPPEQVERRRRTARELGLRPPQRPGGRPWTAEELSLLGKVPDAELAAQTGRTMNAVRVRRTKAGLATARHGRRERGKP
jgi:hypothetical protein